MSVEDQSRFLSTAEKHLGVSAGDIMDNGASERIDIAWEELYVELVTLPGYAGGICKHLRMEDMTCQMCGKVFDGCHTPV